MIIQTIMMVMMIIVVVNIINDSNNNAAGRPRKTTLRVKLQAIANKQINKRKQNNTRT